MSVKVQLSEKVFMYIFIWKYNVYKQCNILRNTNLIELQLSTDTFGDELLTQTRYLFHKGNSRIKSEQHNGYNPRKRIG